MNWPKDTPEALNDFYGKHEFKSDGMPTDAWISEHLKLFATPYPLALAWNSSERVRKIRCHKLVGESLVRIFEEILGYYGSYADVQAARMHLYTVAYK